ncbi:MAG: hypothetical protein LH474_05660 [Chamaesiphon sp.]|nr:hypothetical protein [Chamaesiphon sp.]
MTENQVAVTNTGIFIGMIRQTAPSYRSEYLDQVTVDILVPIVDTALVWYDRGHLNLYV